MFSEIIKKIYPENYYGSECGIFAHKLADFGSVGNSYKEKKRYVELYGIIYPNIKEIGRGFRVGDVLVTSEGTFLGFGNGHVAVCIEIRNGQPIVVESNFNKDGRVHYGRAVPLNKIYGIIRAPLKIDLGQVEINYNVFINNQKWNVGFLDGLQRDILRFTEDKLKVNFYPLHTEFKNWWYETIIYPLTRQEAKVIAKGYMKEMVEPLAFTSNNKPSDVYCLMVRPDQWQGTITGGQELAYCSPDTSPTQIQASCAELDVSPWYFGLELSSHILIHELSHRLHWINGMDDTTHFFDNLDGELEKVFSDLDWNRIKANL